MNRGGAQPQNQPASHGGSHKSKRFSLMNLRTASVALLFCITVLIVALVGFVVIGGPKPENKYVSEDKLQAVFLNGGQVYFGNITNLNEQYLRMTDIYYLRVNQAVQPDQDSDKQQASQNDISLVKLGCELHGPTDEMLINREQIIFWENLKADGQVTKAVAEYVKQNPDGQKCETGTNTNTNSGTNTNTNNTTAP